MAAGFRWDIALAMNETMVDDVMHPQIAIAVSTPRRLFLPPMTNDLVAAEKDLGTNTTTVFPADIEIPRGDPRWVALEATHQRSEGIECPTIVCKKSEGAVITVSAAEVPLLGLNIFGDALAKLGNTTRNEPLIVECFGPEVADQIERLFQADPHERLDILNVASNRRAPVLYGSDHGDDNTTVTEFTVETQNLGERTGIAEGACVNTAFAYATSFIEQIATFPIVQATATKDTGWSAGF